jgi:hypothetical protein
MSNELLLLLIGGFIGLFSSIIGTITSHFLAMRAQKRKYELDLHFIAEKDKIEETLRTTRRNEAIREEIANPDISQRRRELAARVRGDNNLLVSPDSGILVAPEGKLACFGATMKVCMADGTVKEIAECEVGDKLLTVNTLSRDQENSTISDIVKEEVEQYILLNDQIEITASHLVCDANYLPRRVDALFVGDFICSIEEELIQVVKIELVQEKITVYNISTDDSNYICVEDILASNYQGKIITDGETWW